MRKHQGGQEIAAQLASQREDLGIFSWPFSAAIDAVVVIRAIATVFAVRLVVLSFVTDDIGKREAVMNRNVIDACARAAVVMSTAVAATISRTDPVCVIGLPLLEIEAVL